VNTLSNYQVDIATSAEEQTAAANTISEGATGAAGTVTEINVQMHNLNDNAQALRDIAAVSQASAVELGHLADSLLDTMDTDATP
jgi:hypothetical protein